jgi:hypothetical protein
VIRRSAGAEETDKGQDWLAVSLYKYNVLLPGLSERLSFRDASKNFGDALKGVP